MCDWLKFRLKYKVNLRVRRVKPDHTRVISDCDAVSCIDSYNFYCDLLKKDIYVLMKR